MSRRASVNPSDQDAQARAAQGAKIADVGRIAHVHPPWPQPGGIPTLADITALGDGRWVQLTGDEMSGPLFLNVGGAGTNSALVVLGSSAASVPPVSVRRVGGSPYIEFRSADGLTRLGYVQ